LEHNGAGTSSEETLLFETETKERSKLPAANIHNAVTTGDYLGCWQFLKQIHYLLHPVK
jgi:hypothetical protein